MKHTVTAEIFYSAAWHTIPVRTLEPIVITRGRADQLSRVSPAKMTLTIDNRSGLYSPRDPNSSLYGLIGRNTRIRLSVSSPPTSGFRFYGEVESWPQKWSPDDVDAWVPITANGILRRLGGNGTVGAAYPDIYRYTLTQSPRAYWPMSEGSLSVAAAGATSNTSQLIVLQAPTVGGAARFGSGDLGSWLPPGLDFQGTGSIFYANVPGAAPATTVAVDLLLRGFGADDPSAVLLWALSGPPSDFVPFYEIQAIWNSGAPTMALVDGGGTLATASAAVAAAPWDDQLHHWRLLLAESGANINATVYLDGVSVMSGTRNSVNLDPIKAVLFGVTHADRRAFGHVTVWVDSIPSVTDAVSAAFGHPAETVATRIARLCTEEGITLALTGAGTMALGHQRTLPVAELLQEVADSDGGILVEDRTQFGLKYRTNASLYNQSAAATLNYSAGGEIAPPLEPVEDTRFIQNDVTVSRVDGGAARVIQTSGILNVNEPVTDPQGVGRYPVTLALNVDDDDQLTDLAGWRLHIGTSDAARYPSVVVDYDAMKADNKTALMTSVEAIDVGDLISVSNPPSFTGPGPIKLIVQGYTETIETHRRTIVFETIPADPWTVGVLDSSILGRLDSAASTLNGSHNATTTSLSVAFTGPRWIDSATFGAQFPFDIDIDGEQITVTAITGTTSPQTFTVTRSVNGVSKAHSSGATVSLNTPIILARK